MSKEVSAHAVEAGVNKTTPSGMDTTKPSGLNVSKPLEHAYAHNGFIGRHEHDYVATGVDGGNPDTWPTGRTVLFFDVVDLFNTRKGAQKVEEASEQNLRSHGSAPVSDSSLGSGEKVRSVAAFWFAAVEHDHLRAARDVHPQDRRQLQGCQQGSIESSLKSLAMTQPGLPDCTYP